MNKTLKVILPVASAAAVVGPTVCMVSCVKQTNLDSWNDTQRRIESKKISIEKGKKYDFFIDLSCLPSSEQLINSYLALEQINIKVVQYDDAYLLYLRNNKIKFNCSIIDGKLQVTQEIITTNKMKGICFKGVTFDMEWDVTKAIFQLPKEQK